MKIEIGREIAALCPNLCVLAIQAQVENTLYDEVLWQEINLLEQQILIIKK